jgi:hypothetical protein
VDEIMTGSPSISKLVKHGVDSWEVHNDAISHYRDSSLFTLAAKFLTRKELPEIKKALGETDG